MELAVGDKKAQDVAAVEGWDKEAASAGEEWMKSAKSAVAGSTDGAGAGGGGDVKNGGDNKGSGDNGNGNNAAVGGDGADAAAAAAAAAEEAEKRAENDAAEEAARLAQSILDEYHAPCVAEVGASDPKGRRAMAACAKIAEKQWDVEESARPEELKGRKATALEPAIKKREAEHLDW